LHTLTGNGPLAIVAFIAFVVFALTPGVLSLLALFIAVAGFGVIGVRMLWRQRHINAHIHRHGTPGEFGAEQMRAINDINVGNRP
jgi:hypothetical protein